MIYPHLISQNTSDMDVELVMCSYVISYLVSARSLHFFLLVDIFYS